MFLLTNSRQQKVIHAPDPYLFDSRLSDACNNGFIIVEGTYMVCRKNEEKFLYKIVLQPEVYYSVLVERYV